MGELQVKGVRFAPSPTGTFHLGNLRTAWISHAWARALGTPWVVRFEDIDRPRVVQGSREGQLRDMAALGLHPDRTELQSDRHGVHLAEFERAAREGVIYRCTCSRREVQAALEASASAPHSPGVAYTGHCRPAEPTAQTLAPGSAWRFRMPRSERDPIAGRILTDGTFVPAYPWACALDDLADYALLVRAYDLEEALEVQRAIQAWAGGPEFRPPAVFHTSLVTQDDGHRLEKRTRGVTLAEWDRPVTELAGLFGKGFAPSPGDWAPGRVFGEPHRQRTLQELGIRVKL